MYLFIPICPLFHFWRNSRHFAAGGFDKGFEKVRKQSVFYVFPLRFPPLFGILWIVLPFFLVTYCAFGILRFHVLYLWSQRARVLFWVTALRQTTTIAQCGDGSQLQLTNVGYYSLAQRGGWRFCSWVHLLLWLKADAQSLVFSLLSSRCRLTGWVSIH